MKLKSLPVIPTIIVLLAVAIMIALGFWQLGRMGEKEALLADYARAGSRDEIVPQNIWAKKPESFGYRKVASRCGSPGKTQLVAGRSVRGAAGWAQIVPCSFTSLSGAEGSYAIVLGWSQKPEAVSWQGGDFTGVLVPTRKVGIEFREGQNGGGDAQRAQEASNFYIVADPPLANLTANAAPDPRDIPNNHLSYAVQWFLFALTALVIFVLAVRKRAGAA